MRGSGVGEFVLVVAPALGFAFVLRFAGTGIEIIAAAELLGGWGRRA